MITKLLALLPITTNKSKLIGLSEVKALSTSIEDLDQYVSFLRTVQIFYNENRERLDFSKYALLHTVFGKLDEELDENNLKLGNIWGLWTFSVQYWKTKKDEPKGNLGFPSLERYNGYDVILEQARENVIAIGEEVQSIEE